MGMSTATLTIITVILSATTLSFVIYGLWRNYWRGPCIKVSVEHAEVGGRGVKNGVEIIDWHYINVRFDNDGSKDGYIDNFKVKNFDEKAKKYGLEAIVEPRVPRQLVKRGTPCSFSFKVEYKGDPDSLKNFYSSKPSSLNCTISYEKDTKKGKKEDEFSVLLPITYSKTI